MALRLTFMKIVRIAVQRPGRRTKLHVTLVLLRRAFRLASPAGNSRGAEMSVVESPKSQGLIARVTGILSRPQAEWDVIAPEAATTQSLMFGYAAILAALPAIAQAIHGLMPHCIFGVCYTSNPVFAVSAAVAYSIITLASVFVMGLII